MIRRLAAARPAAIAYDIFFTEPGPPARDADLAAAMTDAHAVLLPVLFEAPGRDGRAIAVTQPVPPIADAAAGLGQVALLPDDDGTARSVMLSLRVEGRAWPHLMELAYRLAMHERSPAFRRTVRSHDDAVTIPFQATTGAFRSVSFASVLAGEVPAAFLRDRIVLVGVTAGGLGDRYRVPLRDGGTMPGIEIQAVDARAAGGVAAAEPAAADRFLVVDAPPDAVDGRHIDRGDAGGAGRHARVRRMVAAADADADRATDGLSALGMAQAAGDRSHDRRGTGPVRA
jgi:hypothetical protein